MSRPELLDIMARVDSFPSMPGSASKLLKLLDNPDSTASQVEEVLRLDPGLTANVLKLTNSAYFGLPTKVASVKQAVVLLGWKTIFKLVMTSCMNAVMGKQVPGYDLSPGELWRHSIAVTAAAEGLMKELNIPPADEVFTAALLHDVGKLALGDFVREDIKELDALAAQGVSFQEAEHKILGADHAEIGAHILDNWSLPPAIVEAVRWHHSPDSAAATNTVIDIVHVADVLCLMIGIGVGREGLQYEPLPSATKRLGLRPAHLEMVASQTLQWVEELTDVF